MGKNIDRLPYIDSGVIPVTDVNGRELYKIEQRSYRRSKVSLEDSFELKKQGWIFKASWLKNGRTRYDMYQRIVKTEGWGPAYRLT